MHQAAAQTQPRKSNAGLFAVLFLSVICVLYYFSSHTPGEALREPRLQIFKTLFVSVILEALPFILIGVLVSAVLQVYVSDAFIRRLIPRNPLLGILVAGLIGIIFPICECGMVPAVRNLIRKGMPLHAASAFILVGPILNPIVFWSTWTAFRSRPEIVWARMGLALAVALVVGLIVYRYVRTDVLRGSGSQNHHQDNDHRDHAHNHNHAHHDHHDHVHNHDHHDHAHHHAHSPGRSKLADLMGHSVSEFFDMGKYLMFGAMLVALLQTFVAQNSLLALGHGQGSSNLFMMGLGFILSLCSTSDAFVAQSFMTTFSKGALVAFMVFGPMLNLKSLLMMLAVFKTKFVLLLASLVFVFVYAGSWALEAWVLK
ncbi:permease [Paenibacillus sepulcri]|uniref:Permease n=1 Tax=Paenibacillus sepulcri TaxID=359917 RepID=A0ABS7C0E4_9BACL|nr:permease [Paenibacillus sepulcri]